ncbi:U-box domain-containing protein [Drosera capensis]
MSPQTIDSPPPPPSPSSSSTWFFSPPIKSRLLSRIRRSFAPLKPVKQATASSDDQFSDDLVVDDSIEQVSWGSNGEFQLVETTDDHDEDEIVDNGSDDEEEEEVAAAAVRRAVKELHFGDWEEKEKAAREIKRLARRKDVKLRKHLAELGVIPPLVAMVDSQARGQVAVQALIQLTTGTFTNKAMVVEAGILSKLPANAEISDPQTRQDFAQLLFSISSLATAHFPLRPSTILPFLSGVLESDSTIETKEACIGTLHNLSTALENTGPLITNGVADMLLRLASIKEISEKALSTLANLAMTSMGKKALEDNAFVPEILIEIMTWEDRPKCQELSAYMLMILAHQNVEQQEKMTKSGIVQVLLEVLLLGSPLAQRRALKMLQWFKDERQAPKMPGSHSGPQSRGSSIADSPVSESESSDGKRMMKKMVKESLDKNMAVIIRRAKVAGESNKMKSLVISSSSKSLPY